jgi:hypothetical protein
MREKWVHWAGEEPADYTAAGLEWTLKRENVTCPECIWLLETLDKVNARRDR